jgi:hypothetical protein
VSQLSQPPCHITIDGSIPLLQAPRAPHAPKVVERDVIPPGVTGFVCEIQLAVTLWIIEYMTNTGPFDNENLRVYVA